MSRYVRLPRPSRNAIGWLHLGLAIDLAIPTTFSVPMIKDAIDDHLRWILYKIEQKIGKKVAYTPIQALNHPSQIDIELLYQVNFFYNKWKSKTVDEMADAMEKGLILEPVAHSKLEKAEGRADTKLEKILDRRHIDTIWDM